MTTSADIKRIVGSRLWPWLALFLLWELVFTVSCMISLGHSADAEGRVAPISHDSAANAVLRESRGALSGHFYEMADLYFHKGVEHQCASAFNGRLFQRLAETVSPRGHFHLEGDAIKEMMPWLRLAITMDPHDVDIYLVTAFWLAVGMDHQVEAHEILGLAQCNNPRNYKVQLEKGRICLKGRRIKEATEAFDAGLAFWPNGAQMDIDADRQLACADKEALLLYRALLYEVAGENNKAIGALREIMQMRPDNVFIKRRIAALRNGREPSVMAARLWEELLDEESASRRRGHCDERADEHEVNTSTQHDNQGLDYGLRENGHDHHADCECEAN